MLEDGDYVIHRYPKGEGGYEDVDYFRISWMECIVHKETNVGYKKVFQTDIK